MFFGLISTPQPIELAYLIGGVCGAIIIMAVDSIAKRIRKYIHFKD